MSCYAFKTFQALSYQTYSFNHLMCLVYAFEWVERWRKAVAENRDIPLNSSHASVSNTSHIHMWLMIHLLLLLRPPYFECRWLKGADKLVKQIKCLPWFPHFPYVSTGVVVTKNSNKISIFYGLTDVHTLFYSSNFGIGSEDVNVIC